MSKRMLFKFAFVSVRVPAWQNFKRPKMMIGRLVLKNIFSRKNRTEEVDFLGSLF